MTKRIVELCKTLLLICLTVSALYLTYLSNIGADFFAPVSRLASVLAGRASEDGVSAAAVTPSEASRPTAMAVRNDIGLCGIMYSDEDLDYSYGTLGRYLGEALATAQEPAEITEEKWRQALLTSGVYYRFPSPVPISALAQWLGAGYSGGDYASGSFCLCAEDGSAALYFRSGTGFYRCATGVRTDYLTGLLTRYVPNAAGFAFELSSASPAYGKCDPYSLLPAASSVSLPEVTAVNPLNDKEKKNGVITALGFNPYTASGYTDPDTGVLIFVENSATISIGASGLVTYLNTADTAEASRFQVYSKGDSPADAELIETARAAVSEVSTGGGAAGLRLSGYTRNEDICVVNFSYYINGLKIRSSSDYAARVVIRGGVVSELSLMQREYSVSESGYISLLPPLHAAAAIASQDRPLLVPEYADGGGENLTAGWSSR